MMDHPRRLVLASGSAYRKALLERLGLPFEVFVSHVDETPLPGEAPSDTALRLSVLKARAVAQHGELIIGSDQVAAAGGRRYGKPGGTRQGYVDRPYTMADAEATLAGLTDRAFARDFFDRYIKGRELADYRRLLTPAGFLVRPAPRGNLEVVPVESAGGTLTAAQRAFRERWLGPK